MPEVIVLVIALVLVAPLLLGRGIGSDKSFQGRGLVVVVKGLKGGETRGDGPLLLLQ